ncbi:MAG: lysophospholipase [Oscillospiraceae bacterium]|nr:lysophospholipase [Oscillospiraceae bacterium]
MREFTLDPEKSLTLTCREYRPEGDPVGILQVIHGLGEHQGRYVSFARFLAENGFAVYTSDLPGHGPAAAETGSLGRFPRGGWLQAAEGQHALLERAKELWPGKPVFLFGHSMGSFLARSCLILWPGGLQGCILCGTGHLARPLVAAGSAAAEVTAKLRGEDNVSEFLRKMAFGSYNQRIPEAASPNAWICRDEAVVAAYDADPLCGLTPSSGLIREMMRGIRLITDPAKQKRMDPELPVLFISGEEDPVGEYGAGVRRALESFRKAGMKRAELRLYPGDRHELINELDRDAVWGDILAWLKAHE